ncbi:hypothetical protein [Paraburkholderia humisilvae]|uniref:Uncharacterized protein n=1 Tax=Paraburkholderia humisilvae TaxID=627669 RepID=A0A6J5DXY9_9BURK|nr:hypothetical protein [Paraburkholderia humisilvae]CAB3757826.1 hypothetical protein LMG29542_03153 [Paraburkholderia humisilvae]
MKLNIAEATCSLAVQAVFNEPGYIPVLALDDELHEISSASKRGHR